LTKPDDDESRLKLAEWVPRPSSGWPKWQFDGGYISRKFVTNADLVTDPDDEIVELNRPYVLICDNKLIGLLPILWLLESVIQSHRPLLIIADDVGGEALGTLLINQQRGNLKAGAVKAPGVGDRREVMLRDIANLTGGKVISGDLGIRLENATLDMLGGAERVVIEKDKTTIIGGRRQADQESSRAAALA